MLPIEWHENLVHPAHEFGVLLLCDGALGGVLFRHAPQQLPVLCDQLLEADVPEKLFLLLLEDESVEYKF